jgi:putative spermidine/putrescine transport system permease protein
MGSREKTRRLCTGRFLTFVSSAGLPLFCGLVFFYLILPICIILPISFSASPYLEFPPRGFSLQWYQRYFESSGWIDATVLSLQVAVVVTFFATVIGTAAALGLARGRFRGKQWIHALIISPMVIPAIIIAIAFYFLFAGWKLIGTPTGLILAHTVMALPFVVVNVTAALKGFDERLEQAAMNLGANRLQTFFRITLPLISPGVFTGALFAFITSFDEIVIAIFIAGSRAATLPKQMWDGIRMEINPTTAAVSTLLVSVSVILLLLVEWLRRYSEKKKN